MRAEACHYYVIRTKSGGYEGYCLEVPVVYAHAHPEIAGQGVRNMVAMLIRRFGAVGADGPPPVVEFPRVFLPTVGDA